MSPLSPLSPHVLRRSWLLTPLALVTFAGCQQDVNAPPLRPTVHFAQGDNGVWTVNSLADPGNGLCDDAECTLREAIAAAASGHKIVTASGLQGDIKLVDSVTVANNESFTGGGGIGAFTSTITIRNSVIADNITIGAGGGIDNCGSLTIINTTIQGNKGNRGGGLRNCDTVTLIGSTISGNQADTEGGGIYNASGASVTAERSTISGNRASAAAGIYSRANLSLRSVTVTGNSAAQRSGGLEVSFLTGEPAAVTRIANTIIAGNIAPAGAAPDCFDFALNGSSLGYNLTTTGGGCPFAAAGDRLVSSAQLFTEVLEADLKDNGGHGQPDRRQDQRQAGRAAHLFRPGAEPRSTDGA